MESKLETLKFFQERRERRDPFWIRSNIIIEEKYIKNIEIFFEIERRSTERREIFWIWSNNIIEEKKGNFEPGLEI